MANALSDAGRNGFLSASYSWPGGTWVPYILGSFNAGLLATGAKLSDFGSGVFRARGTYLTNRTASAGVADADDTVIGAVGSGGAATGVYIALFLEASGGAVSSDCAWFAAAIDTASVIPFLPNGGDLSVVWDNASSRIFKL